MIVVLRSILIKMVIALCLSIANPLLALLVSCYKRGIFMDMFNPQRFYWVTHARKQRQRQLSMKMLDILQLIVLNYVPRPLTVNILSLSQMAGGIVVF